MNGKNDHVLILNELVKGMSKEHIKSCFTAGVYLPLKYI